MQKGILHLRKKPRHVLFESKKFPIKKEVPEIGKEFDKLSCEFEGNPVTKIIVGDEEFSADLKVIEARKETKRLIDEREIDYQKILEQQAKGKDSFSLVHARVPADTRRCLINDGDNFYLKLNQFARYDYKDNKEQQEDFIFMNSKISIVPNFGNSNAHEAIVSRLKDSANSIYPNGGLLTLEFKPEWRLTTGLGGNSVYETGITLHHIYGVPYIPASSIKGVLRSWIIYSEFENNEGMAIEDEMFCNVFGCPSEITIEINSVKKRFKSFYKEARKGKIAFFDGLPIESPKIVPDVMNVHYPDWYNKKGAPTDDQNPNPVFFLTVKDTNFQFLLGSKDFDLHTQVFWQRKTFGWWLENALYEHGIGAKTAVGYGYMQKVNR